MYYSVYRTCIAVVYIPSNAMESGKRMGRIGPQETHRLCGRPVPVPGDDGGERPPPPAHAASSCLT